MDELQAGMEQLRSPSKAAARVRVRSRAGDGADYMPIHGVAMPSSAPAMHAADGLQPKASRASKLVFSSAAETEPSSVPPCSRTVPPRPTPPLLPVHSGTVHRTLKMSGRTYTKAEWKVMESTQRNSQGLWASPWLFPTRSPSGEVDPFERSSLVATPHFVCHGVLGCEVGDCLAQCQSCDVQEARRTFRAQFLNHNTTGYADSKCRVQDELERRLRLHYDRGSRTWKPILHALSPTASVELCPAAYAVLLGVTSNQYVKVKKNILETDAPTVRNVMPANELERQSLETLDRSLLRAYVRDLVATAGEANPAPGARQDKKAYVDKTTLVEK
jgi:hypothetical protein